MAGRDPGCRSLPLGHIVSLTVQPRRSASCSTVCQERRFSEPTEITRPILERSQHWLYHYRKTNGQPQFGFRTQHTRSQAIKSIFQWMARQNHLLHNPASEIVLQRMEHQLPKHGLTAEEAEQIIQQSIQNPEGLRGSAVLETFYSTGKRRMELEQLRLWLRAVVDQPILRREKKGGFCSGVPPCRSRATGFSGNRS